MTGSAALHQSVRARMVQSRKEVDDFGIIQTYGLSVICSCSSDETPLLCVEDISTNPLFVERLEKCLSENDVCPYHVFDIIEDFIA